MESESYAVDAMEDIAEARIDAMGLKGDDLVFMREVRGAMWCCCRRAYATSAREALALAFGRLRARRYV